jgi:hypothetical protein
MFLTIRSIILIIEVIVNYYRNYREAMIIKLMVKTHCFIEFGKNQIDKSTCTWKMIKLLKEYMD